jgi:hypothetical protein
MLGDRQGWMIERTDAAVRPTESDRVQPCIAYPANLSREHVSRIQRTGSMPTENRNNACKERASEFLADDIGRKSPRR